MGNHPYGDDGPRAGKSCLTKAAKFTRDAVILPYCRQGGCFGTQVPKQPLYEWEGFPALRRGCGTWTVYKRDSETRYIRQRDDRRKNVAQNAPFRREAGLEKGHTLWSLFILALSFSLSVLLLWASGSLFERTGIVWALLVVFLIIAVGVLFDMIGMAVTAAEETPFHSMASRRIRGAKQSIRLIRNASRVSSICNDVVGDICSVVSGSAGAAIVFGMFGPYSDSTWAETFMGAAIAGLTVGGKAFGKHFGIRNSNYIIFQVGRLFSLFERNRRQARRKA